MNRREFTRGVASLGLAPIVPTASVAATTATAATAATATADHMYFVSWYTARLSKTCSAGQLVRDFDLDPSVAKEILARLVRDKTVSAPDMFGISQTLNPFRNTVTQASTLGSGVPDGRGGVEGGSRVEGSWGEKLDQLPRSEPPRATEVSPCDPVDENLGTDPVNAGSTQPAQADEIPSIETAQKQDIET